METDRTVQQQKQVQRSSISTLQTSLHQRLAEQLPVRRATVGGSAARITTAAAFSALSSRAAPTVTPRSAMVASSRRSAFTNPQD